LASFDRDIDALDGLVTVTLESVRCYGGARYATANAEVKLQLAKRVIERRHVSEQLELEVFRLRGHPPTESGRNFRTSQAEHPALDRPGPQTDRSIVLEIEARETKLKRQYQKALADPSLSPVGRNLVQRAYEIVKLGHDELLNLRHLIRAGLEPTAAAPTITLLNLVGADRFHGRPADAARNMEVDPSDDRPM
jgi:uncharacterized protein (TIGR02284 family)